MDIKNYTNKLTADEKKLFNGCSTLGKHLKKFTESLAGTDNENFQNEFSDHIKDLKDLMLTILSLPHNGSPDESTMEEIISIVEAAIEE